MVHPCVVMKWNTLLIHITTWINPNGITLSEKSHPPKGNLIILHDCIYTIFSKRQNYMDREQSSSCQAVGGIGKHVLIKKQRKRVGGELRVGNGTVLYLNCGNGYINLYIC